MNRRRAGLLIVLALIAVSLGGCANSPTIDQPAAKSIDAITAQAETVPVELSYMGVISAKNQVKHAFAVGGKVASVNVSVGQWVSEGQALASLDSSDLNLALANAEAQVSMLEAQYHKALGGAVASEQNVVKAEEAYAYAQDQYERLERLYAQDAVSKQALDQAHLQLVQSEASLKQAQAAYDSAKGGAEADDAQMASAQLQQAQIGLQQRQKACADATLRAQISGYVTSILLKSGEYTGAATPAVVVQDTHLLATTGVTDRDVQQLQIGQTGTVVVGEQVFTGTVTELGQAPDAQTRTYKLTVDLGSIEGVTVGSIAQVTVAVGEEQGIWVPIEAVLSNGEDFVYVVENDQAMKRAVTLGVVDNTRVSVTGVEDGEVLAISGVKALTDGVLVTIGELDGEVQAK